jgi:HrpA-like RNA helicase
VYSILDELLKWKKANQIDHRWLPLFPLYSSLDNDRQQEALNDKRRKIIVSTNIAETSITIDNIECVIDMGWVKQSIYNGETRFTSLEKVRTSKASAEQRKGRSGRTCDGFCYRLYTLEEYSAFEEYTKPEIQRSSIDSIVLKLVDLNVVDFKGFPFFSPPELQSLRNSLELLVYLGAIDQKTFKLTEIGGTLVLFPCDPQLAMILYTSIKMSEDLQNRDNKNVFYYVATILAMLSENIVLSKFPHDLIETKGSYLNSGDFFYLLRIFILYSNSDNKYKRN